MEHNAEPLLFTNRIAIMESDRSTAEMLHTFFRLMELEPVLIPADERAVSTLRRMAPAVALIDLDLPDLRGLEIARELRNAIPRIGIVFSSARAVTLEGETVIRKPGQRFEDLLHLMEVVLEAANRE